jgi:hypothetical protein
MFNCDIIQISTGCQDKTSLNRLNKVLRIKTKGNIIIIHARIEHIIVK